MAYLSQTLNGVLQNEELNETKQQLAEVQRMIAKLQDGATKSKTRSGTASSGKEPVQDS